MSLTGKGDAMLELKDFPERSKWRGDEQEGQNPASLLQASSRRGDSVRSVVWASGKHCAAAGMTNSNDRKGLLWSCEARMAFCEMEWHMAGTPMPASQQYYRERPRFLGHAR